MSGPGTTTEAPFWERKEVVEQFAAREPDHRLVKLAGEYVHPPAVRVLDLGAAAGRNTIYLARLGFDVIAVDASDAMVRETRARLADVLDPEEAERRVRRARMDALPHVADGEIDLIVALGVYHAAASRPEWNRALAESHRMLARGGRLLVANHTDGFHPGGAGLIPVPDDPALFDGLASGRSFLVGADVLDLEMARHGLVPYAPTETVARETDEGGRRVTANGYFLRP